MDLVGFPIMKFYGILEQYETVRQSYEEYNAVIVFIAAFTPIPYKLITITAGAFKLNILTFTIASLIGRSARFFLVAWLIHRFGQRIKEFIEKYFDILSLIFVGLVVLGFIIATKWGVR